MARPRTPTALLELRGAFKNHPSRLKERKNEPIVTARLPPPPSYLTSAVSETWREMAKEGFWLTSADQFLTEIAATYMARYRVDELKSGDISLLIGLLSKVGFSPKDRARLNLPTNST
jgi:phage terminase small subunit